MRSIRLAAYIGVIALLSIAAGGKADAHGGVAIEFDTCVSELGKYRLHFTAYMAGEGTEYCWELPMPGKAIMVFDLQQAEMRTKPIEFRVVETSDEANPASPLRTLVHLEPKSYPTGTLNAEASFEEGKNYMAVLTIADARPLVLKAPIRVVVSSGMSYVLISVVLLLAIGVGGFLMWRQRTSVGPAKA